jgi:hypothetical protein
MDLFKGIPGTWLSFGLMLAATYVVGYLIRP